VRRGAAGWTTNGFASAGGRVWAPVGILMWGVESEMAGRYKRRGRGLAMGWGGAVRSEGGEAGGGCLFVCLQCADSWVLEPPLAPRIS